MTESDKDILHTVKVPDEIIPLFKEAENIVSKYFDNLQMDPKSARIDIDGERYVLIRAGALSIDFLESIQKFYADRGELQASIIGRNMLFDLAHFIGLDDAKEFHKKMGLNDPLAKLSAGPVHFAHTGWAFVNIHSNSNPSPNDDFFLSYDHPHSFEADAWIKAGKTSKFPVCIMNAGYSSGWCEESFGISLTAVEVTCRAKGDDKCRFIMAPPHRVEEYLEEKLDEKDRVHDIPSFLQRKTNEEKIQKTIEEKEVLLKEIHHRVKNNLQVVCSLLNLQTSFIKDEDAKEKINESISRIRSIAVLHELLYSTTDIKDVNAIDYINLVVQEIRKGLLAENTINIEITCNDSSHQLDIDVAMPLGLVLHELIINAAKYAFEGNRNPEIKIHFKSGPENILTIEDNGAGMASETDAQGLGFQLIEALCEQINATIDISSQINKGTSVVLTFSNTI